MSLGSNLNRAAGKVAGKFGAAVTFTLAVPGIYDSATDSFTSSTSSSVTGNAVRDAGDPERYARLGLTATEAPTLFFTPTTYGQLPALGATVTWGGATYTVRDVLAIAPDGTAIAASVVVAK